MHTGDVIDDRFVIERFVARGGMGEVYRAHDRQSDKPVALKILIGDDHDLVERFRVEARALIDLDHPAIVRHVAHGVAPVFGAYLAMEWLDGTTLAGWLKKHPLSLDEALRMAARIAEATGAAHKRGMVHRDIKPGNLFLVSNRVDAAKLLDFGLVRNLWRQATVTAAGMGTPNYMAPEQVRCERDVGPPADVFALGCVLYRCLVGHMAFEGERAEAVLAKIAMFRDPPRVAERAAVPAAVDDLIAHMMARDPAQRPADGTAAAAAIRAVRAALTGTEGRASSPPPQALTSSEQLPVAVLFVDMDRKRKHRVTPFDRHADAIAATVQVAVRDQLGELSLRPDIDPQVQLIRQTVEPLGGRVVPLAHGTLLITLQGGATAADLAVRAARCALSVRAVMPAAGVSLTTQQAVVDGRHAAEALIDGAAAMRRARQIHLDARTRDLLPDLFEVVAGVGGLVLVAERPQETVARTVLGHVTPFVGRQAVLRQLDAAVGGAFEDRTAHAVLVVGDAGAGKSRLRAELLVAIRAAHPGVAIAEAGGEALRAGAPGGLAARTVAAALALPEGPAATRRAAIHARMHALPDKKADAPTARLVDFLGELLGAPPAEDSPALRAARQDPKLMADQQRRAFEDWLAAECATKPLLIVLDDLHWADPASIELLAAALRKGRDLPLVVLGFARPEVQHRFPKLQESWLAQEIRLDPLRPQACTQLVREILGAEVEASLVAQLVERSGGSPFYLEELVRAAASTESHSLPQSVVASLQLRIGARPAQARLVLRAAAVYGRVFWSGAVAALLGDEMAAVDLDGWLDLLVKDELIVRRAESRAFPDEQEYAFGHDLLRDAAYQMLTPGDRQAGHRLAGEWLFAHGESDPSVLAEHFAGGGATEQAVTWFERAAEDALAAGAGAGDVAALRKAATWYRRAGETCATAHVNDLARIHLERAVALWTPLDPAEAARTRLALAHVLERAGDRDLALAELGAAVDGSRAGSAELRVDVLLARALMESRTGREGATERARAMAEEALVIARDAGIRALEAKAMTAVAAALVNEGSPEAGRRASDLAQRALTLCDERGQLANALWRLGNSFLVANDLERASRIYEDVVTALDGSGDDLLMAHCTANLGMVSFRRWRLDESIDLTRRALSTYERLGHHTRIQEMTLNLGMVTHLRGDAGAGRLLLTSALAQSGSDWMLSALCQETLSDIDRLGGKEARAQHRLNAAAETCARVGVPSRQAVYLGMLAESLWAGGEAAAAIDALERAAEAAGALTMSHPLVLLHLGPLDEVIELLTPFVEIETDPQRRALAQLGLARAHLWLGDREHASWLVADTATTLAGSRVPRYDLLVTCFRCALAGEIEGALEALTEAQSWCAPHERAEAAVDVGDAMVAGDPSPTACEKYLGLTRDVAHRGVRHHVEEMRCELAERIGDTARARSSLDLARAELERLLGRLPDEYRERLVDHPWARSIRRLRAVP